MPILEKILLAFLKNLILLESQLKENLEPDVKVEPRYTISGEQFIDVSPMKRLEQGGLNLGPTRIQYDLPRLTFKSISNQSNQSILIITF